MSKITNRWTSAALLAAMCCGAATATDAQPAAGPTDTVSLAGPWRFLRDDRNQGLQEQWYAKPLVPSLAGPSTVTLPGTTDEAKAGEPNPQKPTLDGLYRPNIYAGPAWYERDVEIPAAWKEKQVTLRLERVHWVTQVWVDGREMGTQDSLIAPHRYELGFALTPGTHRLTIRVDNTPKINLGKFVSILYEGTQTNWNGIVGRIELEAHDPIWIESQQVYPKNDGTVRVEVAVRNELSEPVWGTITATVAERESGKVVGKGSGKLAYGVGRVLNSRLLTTRSTEKVTLKLDQPPKLWSEFDPALYVVETRLASEGRAGAWQRSDTAATTFGFREFAARATQFTMNGRPIFLRGTLECAIFPLTGYPPCDAAAWQRIYRIMKAHGLNHIRFHSWCPPEAAFAAADIEGIVVQAEGPQANIPAGADPQRDAFIEQEYQRIVDTYGNHPSFCLMTLGNEFGGKIELLTRWVDMLIQRDPRHLYSSASAAPTTPNRQFTEGMPRGIHGPGTDADFGDAIAKQDRPLMGHEIGQWTFYPNFDEIKKYTGVLKASNFELVRDDLKGKGMLDLAPRFFQATGHHAVLLYKEEIEVLLRTPGHAGFSLLDLHDYPGQGTALIGPLDPFWDSKGFVAPEAHKSYCGPTVPLLRMKKRTFTADETFEATVDVAHFGPKDLADVQPRWSIRDAQGREVAAGSLPVRDVPTGKLTPLGGFSTALAKAAAPCKLTVSVAIGTDRGRGAFFAPEGAEFQEGPNREISAPSPSRAEQKGTGRVFASARSARPARTGENVPRPRPAAGEAPFANQWDIWVYPAGGPPRPPKDVVISRQWDDATKKALAEGKKVAFFPARMNFGNSLPGRFLPVFWSPVWFPTQKPNTMGILCDPRHPVFAEFPTEFYSNWQWYDLIQQSRSLVLDDTPADFRPIVMVIDNFARNHKLGNLFEARVGKGRLLVCTIDLASKLDERPAARQFLKSLYGYLASDRFQPAQQLAVPVLDKMFAPPVSTLAKLGAKILEVDSEDTVHGNVAANLIDGDPASFWHTRWGATIDPMPHHLAIDIGRDVAIQAITYLPRQDQANGRIAQCEIYCSRDPKAWGEPVARAKWRKTAELQTVKFQRPVTARYLKLVVTSEVRGQPYAAAAEVDVILSGR